MDFNTAQMLLKETFDSAFGKKLGTRQGRVDLAKICVRKVRCNDPALLVWAVDYCANWKAA